MVTTFRCRRSGNIVSFSNEDDIRGLRAHEGYEEVTETPVATPPTPATMPSETPVENKRRGRPRKES